jgi:hypothetical protein
MLVVMVWIESGRGGIFSELSEEVVELVLFHGKLD